MGYYSDQEQERVPRTPMTPMTQLPTEPGPKYRPDPAAEPAPAGTEGKESFEDICHRYKEKGMGGKMFVVSTNLSQDDDMDTTMEFLFAEPKAASYDRYVKTASISSSKAMRTFVLDNVCHEQRRKLEGLLEDYPAMGISLGEKLLYMLGLSKTTTVRRL